MRRLDLVPPQAAWTRHSLDLAIERGVAFLANELEATTSGLWREYTYPDGSGGSDIWAAAFIAAHVGRVDEARPVAASVTRAILQRHRPSGGWGYDQAILEDCDSTAWVLLAARHTGVAIPRARLVAALRFVLRHQERSGGFVTYGPQGVALFGHIAQRKGWFTAQTCVSAAALMALGSFAPRELPAIDQAANYLLEQAGEDGLWHPYWWHGFSYATYHVVGALKQAQRLSSIDADALATAVLGARCTDGGWAGQDPDHSTAFATALSVLTLSAIADQAPQTKADHDAQTGSDDASEHPRGLWVEALREAVGLLLASQDERGAFMPSAELLVPGGTSDRMLTMLDRGIFTTACVLHALDEVRRMLKSPKGERLS